MDLKEFLENNFLHGRNIPLSSRAFIDVERLGLFFWGRTLKPSVLGDSQSKALLIGGKQFALYYQKHRISLKLLIKIAEQEIREFKVDKLEAQNFLDALACLGEDKIKELIKEMEK